MRNQQSAISRQLRRSTCGPNADRSAFSAGASRTASTHRTANRASMSRLACRGAQAPCTAARIAETSGSSSALAAQRAPPTSQAQALRRHSDTRERCDAMAMRESAVATQSIASASAAGHTESVSASAVRRLGASHSTLHATGRRRRVARVSVRRLSDAFKAMRGGLYSPHDGIGAGGVATAAESRV